MENTIQDTAPKKKWAAPDLTPISGLDSCVEFLYGTGGNPIGTDDPPPP